MSYVRIGIGTVFVVLGAIGVVVPLWPTTPFLLVAACCYVSSERWYQWLISRPVFGEAIQNWREKRAISLRAKISAIVSVFISIGASIFLLGSRLSLLDLLLLTVVAVSVSVFILTRPTLQT